MFLPRGNIPTNKSRPVRRLCSNFFLIFPHSRSSSVIIIIVVIINNCGFPKFSHRNRKPFVTGKCHDQFNIFFISIPLSAVIVCNHEISTKTNSRKTGDNDTSNSNIYKRIDVKQDFGHAVLCSSCVAQCRKHNVIISDSCRRRRRG